MYDMSNKYQIYKIYGLFGIFLLGNLEPPGGSRGGTGVLVVIGLLFKILSKNPLGKPS